MAEKMVAGEASSGSDATMMTGKLGKGGCGQRSGRRRVSRVMIAAAADARMMMMMMR